MILHGRQRYTAQSRAAQLQGSTVVAQRLLLHSMAAGQLQKSPWGKGTITPFPHGKGTGRAVGLLTSTPATWPGQRHGPSSQAMEPHSEVGNQRRESILVPLHPTSCPRFPTRSTLNGCIASKRQTHPSRVLPPALPGCHPSGNGLSLALEAVYDTLHDSDMGGMNILPALCSIVLSPGRYVCPVLSYKRDSVLLRAVNLTFNINQNAPIRVKGF